jgi:hypothetical protein
MRHSSQSGAVLPFVAITLATLMGFSGMAVDVGYLEYWQQQQQTATDAAALGGAQLLARTNCASASNAESAAAIDATENGFTTGGNVTVSAVSPPTSGPYSGNACAISVQISAQHVATFFSRLFGYPNGMSESTQATGTVSSNGGACIYLLSTNTWSSFNGATVSAPSCAIAINYSADFDGGTIASPSIGYAGGTPNYGGTTFTLASPAPMLPIADPCSQIPGCAYLANNPPSTNNCSGYNDNGGNQTISPGCYSYLNLDPPGAVTMKPGLYIINGNFSNNGVTLTGTGVTIYVTASGSAPQLDGSYANTLSAPTSGYSWDGVLYYQVPGNSSNINFNGSNNNFTGLIYAPSSTVNFDNDSGGYYTLVFGATNFNGNTAYDFATPPPGQALIKQAVLAQ